VRDGANLTPRTIARTIANSPLVKCAMHGNDPTGAGSICAAGFAGRPSTRQGTLAIQGTVVFRNGHPSASTPPR
jgi:N-acetylglutamate synthase/N-acetylornithine aminotransferase